MNTHASSLQTRKPGDLCAFGWCDIPRLQGSSFCYRHELEFKRVGRIALLGR